MASSPDLRDIRKRLFANPVFWIDKDVALTRYLEDDPGDPVITAERDAARARVRQFVSDGSITQAAADAEYAFQKEEANG